MKWAAAGLVVVCSSVGARVAAAQGAGGAPPTAQFPDATPNAGTQRATPVAPAPNVAPPSAPPSSPAPLGAPPPPPAGGTDAYPSEPPAPPPAASPPYPYPAPVPIPSDSDEVFSLTISPLHLILPIVQLTGEVRVTPHFGVSLIAGYGAVTLDTTSSDGFSNERTVVSAYEIGGRLIGYPLKKFKSLQLGAQLLYLHLSTDGPVSDTGISATGAGVALGPFFGYKLVTAVGFTFFAQGGFQYIAARGDAHDTAGNSASDNANKFGPLLNLDIGWSF